MLKNVPTGNVQSLLSLLGTPCLHQSSLIQQASKYVNSCVKEVLIQLIVLKAAVYGDVEVDCIEQRGVINYPSK